MCEQNNNLTTFTNCFHFRAGETQKMPIIDRRAHKATPKKAHQ